MASSAEAGSGGDGAFTGRDDAGLEVAALGDDAGPDAVDLDAVDLDAAGLAAAGLGAGGLPGVAGGRVVSASPTSASGLILSASLSDNGTSPSRRPRTGP
ncbi:hypothetical protein ASG59_17210 [Methylobacterium sp. Leaf466]|nr:hypothetical protein ASF39_13980 [Methylobacterium sp. Leaf108]KQT86626.1 hypothetical protein ASG59_17210 [Methylobacterium sp. Leaf466]